MRKAWDIAPLIPLGRHYPNVTFGNHPLVSRFLKGVFELKPSLPRYNHIWDVGVVLKHLKTLKPVDSLDLKVLTLKLTMLLCLLTGQTSGGAKVPKVPNFI